MIVSIDLSIEEAIKAYIKRSEMITLNDVNKIKFDAIVLKSKYQKFIENYENKLCLKFDKWDDDLKFQVKNKFIEKYYSNSILKMSITHHLASLEV